MTKQAYIANCDKIIGAVHDMPFADDFDTTVLRHADSRKWFGIIMKYQGRDIVNLKLKPEDVEFYKSVYDGVITAYHMNKVHWVSIFLESDVPDDALMGLTMESFELTKKRQHRTKSD